jgi:hypothetical protein
MPDFFHRCSRSTAASSAPFELSRDTPHRPHLQAIRRDVESIIPALASRRDEPRFISPYPKTSA